VSGSNFATGVFALAAGNTAPRGIADPDVSLLSTRMAKVGGEEATVAGSGASTAPVNAAFAQIASEVGSDRGWMPSDAGPARLASPTALANDRIRADLLASARVDSFLAARSQETSRENDPSRDLLADLAIRRNASPEPDQDRLFADLSWLDSFALV
jgi:hypothetical protein